MELYRLYVPKPETVAACGAGMLAGASGVFIGHPFDTMKVRLQVNRPFAPSKSIISELYRGWAPPVIMAGILQSISFGLYEYGRRQCSQHFNTSHMQSVLLGGFFSGAISSVLTTPISLIKIQQQVIADNSVRECLVSIIRQHGISGLYHGYSVTVLGDSFGRALYLYTYEYSKMCMNEYNSSNLDLINKESNNTLDIMFGNEFCVQLISAGLAGSVSWGVFYPMDVIKSRLQADMNTTLKQVLKTTFLSYSNIRSLYHGYTYAIVRSVPVAMTILPLYEYIYKHIYNFMK